MILFVNENREIYAFNVNVQKTDIEKYPDAVWYDGEFSFNNGESKKGFMKIFKWDGEKPILEYEPEPITEPEHTLTQLDRIEQAVNLKNEDIANAAVDAFTLELMEGGVI